MTIKPPNIEHSIIVARDYRRKYAAKIIFQALHSVYLDGLADKLTLLLPKGKIAMIRPGEKGPSWEAGVRYNLEIEGFSTATEAEEAGMFGVQALLLAAISLDMGIRLNYGSQEPATVFDRTISKNTGDTVRGEAIASWSQEIVVQELVSAYSKTLRDKRFILSMELFAAACLESNDRARFIMAVSALEPLAKQEDLGKEVADFIKNTCSALDNNPRIPDKVKVKLRQRIHGLKKESIRQALLRLCERWFPNNQIARDDIDYLYGLRSEILHEGRVKDYDIIIAQEFRKLSKYLREIYAKEYEITLKTPTHL